MTESEKKIVLKLLEAWKREATRNLYERSTSIGTDLAKLDNDELIWKNLLDL